MHQELIRELAMITDEERRILEGKQEIYATTYGSIRWYFLLVLVFGVAIIQKLISSGEKIHKKTRKNLEIIRKNR